MTKIDKKPREIWNTDDAPAIDVLAMISVCAASWRPEVRLLGNVRALDIARACEEAIAALTKQ